jgi:tripartite-type tricarboxylate transporter receptor subunit TctC
MRIAALFALLLVSFFANAQGFPSRPLRVIVPQPPGGGYDSMARIVAEPMAAQLGQAVIVENRPGGGTIIGTDAVAKAEPDGYTLLTGGSANIVFTPAMNPSLPFNPRTDFVPIGLAVANTYTLVARSDLPYATLPDLLRFARQNPGKLTYASAGNGTGQHIVAAVLWHVSGVTLTHVPYKGAQAAYQDLLPGRVDLFFDASQTAKAQIDAGRVRAMAVSGPERLPTHPTVPSIRETGAADYDMVNWIGYFAPSATPPAVLARLRAEFARAMALPEVVARFEKSGLRVLRLSQEETAALVASDIDKWTPLLRAAGIRAD